MMTLNLSVAPGNDEEAALALAAFATMIQSLGLKGFSVTLSVNTYGEEDEEKPEADQT